MGDCPRLDYDMKTVELIFTYISVQLGRILFQIRSKAMREQILFHLSQKGPALAIAAFAFLFGGALLLGYL
jgi:hypothetical protein